MWSLFKKKTPAAGPPPPRVAPVAAPRPEAEKAPQPVRVTRDQITRRPTGLEDGPNMAGLPMESFGIERVERFRLITEPKSGTVTVFRPVLVGSREPTGLSFVVARPPEVADLDEVPALALPVSFEADTIAVRAQVGMPFGTSFYGTGGPAGPLLRNRHSTLFWNSDVWRYGESNPALYQSHPYVLAVLPDGSALGLLADTPRRGSLVIGDDGVEFSFEDEPFDLFVIEAASPAGVQELLHQLTGPSPLPPRWALGYHQCRWSYESAAEVLRTAKLFREKNIPCDAVWLDIDHADRFRPFTWNRKAFPDPEGMLKALHDSGFRLVAIVDPALAVDDQDPLFENARDQAHLVADVRNRPIRAHMWPGLSCFPDFTRDETRDWWADLVMRWVRVGIDGVWNDMNEPSVFRVPGKTLPDDARHVGFGGGPHRKFHNVYGLLMTRATRKGLTKAYPDRRPFVLTRSTFLGGHRYAASWTGDNQARWEDLRWSIAMTLNLSLCGQVFTGADIGGFDGDPSPELFVRWFELGTLLPFCRGHSEKSACRKEPWAFGDKVERWVTQALDRRMRLLPTLYTLFQEAESRGLPIVRPIFFADPKDPALRNIDDAFLLGADLLVAPIVEAGAISRSVQLPKGRWFPFETSGGPMEGKIKTDAPLGTVPIFARAGSVVVEGPAANHTAAVDPRHLIIHVFLDRHGRASGRLYEDRGEGFSHLEGEFRETSFEATVKDGRFSLTLNIHGRLLVPDRTLKICVRGTQSDGRILTHEAREASVMTFPLETES